MTDYKIGAGGWAYFQIPGMDPLSAYSKAFNFVEVNSTFYEKPPANQVLSWRDRVPSSFEFSVRCHQDLTHKYGLEPIEKSFEVLSNATKICRVLKAQIVQIQTPPSFRIAPAKAKSVKNLMTSSDLQGIRIAWEIRAPGRGTQLPQYLKKMMQDLDIIHCVDLSREEPAYASDIMYTRLFGKGKHNIYQFDDKELKQINDKAKKRKEKKVVLSFHGLKMYIDAARFKVFNETSTFPQATKFIGLSSLKQVLSEDAHFPTSKEKLIQHQGWKVFDSSPSERIHVSEILTKLPDRNFKDVDEVVSELRGKE